MPVRARPWLAAILSLGVIAGGCAHPTAAPAVPPQAPSSHNTLIVAVSADFPTLDPAQARDTESISAIQLLDQPLFTYGATGAITGLLANRWQWSGGGTVLTVHLNPRATFADGTPVMASDVVFSLERLVAAATGSPHAAVLQDLRGYAQLRSGGAAPGIQAIGARTIVFRLRRPEGFFPEILAMPCTAILEASAVQGAAAANPSWWLAHSVGSGPYSLGAWVAGQSLTLDPVSQYWRQGARLSTGTEGPFAPVEFRIISSASQQARLFAAGAVDVLAPADPAAFAPGLPPAGSHLLVRGNDGVAFLGFNTTAPPFNSTRMRLAVAHAINMSAVAAAAGAEATAGGLVPPGVPGYDAGLSAYAYDPAAARALVAAAGPGVNLSVTLLTIAAGGTAQEGANEGATQVIAHDLDQVGFQVTIRQDTWQQYYRDLAAGRGNLFEGTWLADYPDPQDFIANLLGPGAPGQGARGFTGAVFTHALKVADAASGAARLSAFAAVQKAIRQEAPILPEFYTQSAVLLQPWVQPDTFSVFLRAPLLPQLDRVWLTGVPPAG